MNEQQIRELAEQIAARLFTNGAGEHAERLVLKVDEVRGQYGAKTGGRSLGGWAERAVADQVETLLRDALAGAGVR